MAGSKDQGAHAQQFGCAESVSTLFESLGEEAFRQLESSALESCSSHELGVIATGGGVVERAPNVDLMLRRRREGSEP